MHNNKPYDKSKANCDINAKNEAVNFFIHLLPHTFRQFRTNPYEGTTYEEGLWDLEIFLLTGKKIKVELEQKDESFWEPAPFKYWAVDIPARKKKSSADCFLMFSSKYDRAWLVSREKFDAGKDTEKPCKNFGAVEPFVSIPRKEGTFFSKVNGVWKREEYIEPVVEDD